MKRPIVLVLLIFILFSCKKERELKNLKEDIQGIWEIELSAGEANITTGGSNTTNYPPGNGQTIVFSGSGAFERRNYDTVIFKGVYSLKYKEDCKPRPGNIVLTTDEYSTTYGDYVSIESGKLIISSSNCMEDGGYSYYRRIQ